MNTQNAAEEDSTDPCVFSVMTECLAYTNNSITAFGMKQTYKQEKQSYISKNLWKRIWDSLWMEIFFKHIFFVL